MTPMPMPDYPPSDNVPSDPPNYFPFYTLFSPHAWLGVAVLAAWLLQLLGGAVTSHLGQVLSPEAKRTVKRLHQFWGKCIFATGLATCALGLQDMQVWISSVDP